MTDPLVLCYHVLSSAWKHALAVDPDSFAWQIESLLAAGYGAQTFSSAVDSGTRSPTFVVTFDDGCRSVLDVARPVLAAVGVPATVFVCTDFVGSKEPMAWEGISQWVGGPHEHELLSMSWDDLRVLHSEGWEIGSHTCSHPRLSRLSDTELDRELRDSRLRCEDMLGVPCLTIAYPYGDYDERVAGRTEAAGYAAACTLPISFSGASRYAWPRVGIYHRDGRIRFRAKTSRVARRVRSSTVGIKSRVNQ